MNSVLYTSVKQDGEEEGMSSELNHSRVSSRISVRTKSPYKTAVLDINQDQLVNQFETFNRSPKQARNLISDEGESPFEFNIFRVLSSIKKTPKADS